MGGAAADGFNITAGRGQQTGWGNLLYMYIHERWLIIIACLVGGRERGLGKRLGRARGGRLGKGLGLVCVCSVPVGGGVGWQVAARGLGALCGPAGARAHYYALGPPAPQAHGPHLIAAEG